VASHSTARAGLPVESGIYTVGALGLYPEILHGVSTRLSPDGGDWNLSSRRGTALHPPSAAVALTNRQALARRLGIQLAKMVGCQQVHGSEVAVVRPEDGGRGMYPDLPSMLGADAMVTDVPGIYLLALSADCPPVFFYDPVRKVVGLAHSGWKGTVARIAGNVVSEMSRQFGSNPADVIAAVGPGIGPCCYRVGPDVIEAAEVALAGAWDGPEPVLEPDSEGLTYFNLREAIRRTLLDAGVRPENIAVEEVCTADNLDTFYSHRGEAGQCGLFGAVLGLRGA
jgi:YfiH family protein